MIAALCRDLGRLVQSWWMSDRIRASPEEGRLLRIEPGDLLSIGEARVVVVERSNIRTEAGFNVHLKCHTQLGTAEMQFEIDCDGQLVGILWKDSGGVRLLSSAEFEVWPRRGMI